jgi:hypothetical protein
LVRPGRNLFLLAAFAVFDVPTALVYGQQPDSIASPGEWPQCWRFEAILPDSFPAWGTRDLISGAQAMLDSTEYVRMARDLLFPTPWMLWEDGRGSLPIPNRGDWVVAKAPPLKWRDFPEGRWISYDGGYWGYSMTISNVQQSRSRGVARGYSDVGPPQGQVDVWAERFSCNERGWNPPWPG